MNGRLRAAAKMLKDHVEALLALHFSTGVPAWCCGVERAAVGLRMRDDERASKRKCSL